MVGEKNTFKRNIYWAHMQKMNKMTGLTMKRTFYMNNEEKIREVIDTFYDILSGDTGSERNWHDFKKLFFPDARLIPVAFSDSGERVTTTYDVETYIQRLTTLLEKHDFYEYGYNYKIRCHGHIAQIHSLYEAKNNKTDPVPIKRGTNLIHLIFDGSEWKIVNMLWEDN